MVLMLEPRIFIRQIWLIFLAIKLGIGLPTMHLSFFMVLPVGSRLRAIVIHDL